MMADPRPTRGYATAAPLYVGGGWQPFPLPAGHKSPPPKGFTGQDGRAPTVADVTRWCSSNPHGNVGLHLASTVVGVDVDDYEGKEGGRTLSDLEAAHGSLPPTWSSTSRGEGVSRIMFFRIPDGVTFPGVLGSGIDVIQAHHRYAVVAPSTHPDSGERYRWYTPEGTVATAPPRVDDLPDLPDAWVEALRWGANLEALGYVPPPTPKPATTDHDSIAERIADEHNWHDVLIGDGWQLTRTKTGSSEWTRPGKDQRAGISAVLHEPDGPFNVFSTSVAALQQPWAERKAGSLWSFSMFGYLAATRHGGDRSACASDYRRQANATDALYRTVQTAQIAAQALDDEPAAPDADDELRAMLVDWPTFWAKDTADADWLAEPILAAGRAHAIYAPGGTGKSLFALWLAATMATGRSGLSGEQLRPVRVLYLDYEMTHDDIAERLDAMGFGPDNDLGNLSYAILPSLPPADAPEGGKAIARLAALVDAEIVFLDTFSRAVSGDENDADTVRSFYRWTGIALKGAGRAFVRIDHAGKDIEKGQRGSSAKNDDVDVVWQMVKADGGFTLTAKKRRMGWVPETVALIQHDEPLRYSTFNGMQWPAETGPVAKLLDELGVPVKVGYRQAADALAAVGHAPLRVSIRAAVKFRKYQMGLTQRDHQQNLARTESGQSAPRRTFDCAEQENPGAPLGAPSAQNAKDQVTDSAHPSAHLGAAKSSEHGAAAISDSGAVRTGPGAPEPIDTDEDPYRGLF